MQIHDIQSALMEVAGAAVIAQTTPETQHLVQRCRSQRRQIGKLSYETREIIQNGCHLCLLQHDFRQPDPVGIMRILPWQMVSSVYLLPAHDPTEMRFNHRSPLGIKQFRQPGLTEDALVRLPLPDSLSVLKVWH